MSKQPPPAPTASAVGPCPTIIQIVGRPGTGSLPSVFEILMYFHVYMFFVVFFFQIIDAVNAVNSHASVFRDSN